jgi:hypothetical protein
MYDGIVCALYKKSWYLPIWLYDNHELW